MNSVAESIRNKNQSSYLTLNSGLRFHIQQWDGDDPTCVLIHGFGEGAYIWNQVVPEILPSSRRVAIDLRGHGDSEWDPGADYTTETHVKDMLEVIDALNLEKFDLIGHSLGGQIAIKIAAMRPNRMRSLVIVDFGTDASPEARVHALALFKAGFQAYPSPASYIAWLAPQRPLLEQSALEFLAVSALRRNPDGIFRLKCDPQLCSYYSDDESREDDDLDGQLAAISCRALVLRGAGSAILSKKFAQNMVRQLRQGHLKTVPSAGHAVMTDNPRYFTSVVNDFLSERSEETFTQSQRVG